MKYDEWNPYRVPPESDDQHDVQGILASMLPNKIILRPGSCCETSHYEVCIMRCKIDPPMLENDSKTSDVKHTLFSIGNLIQSGHRQNIALPDRCQGLSWKKSSTVALVLFHTLCALPPAQADLSYDHSLNQSSPNGLQTASHIEVPSTYGTISGSNLFHSFTEFGVRTGQTVTFTDPGNANLANIFGRVTGSNVTSIDGTLQVDGVSMPNANLYLINPNGILIGHTAVIDVPGSFYASTANSIKFTDNTVFSATANLADPVLTVAEPRAFGFLANAAPANISVGERQGDPQSLNMTIQMPNGKSFYLVGGNVDISNTDIIATEGTIHLIAVHQGDVPIDGASSINLKNQGGTVTLYNTTAAAFSVDNGSGSITVEGKDVHLTGSALSTTAFGTANGGDIRVRAHTMEMDSSTDYSSRIQNRVRSVNAIAGHGGQTSLQADTLTMLDGSSINSETRNAASSTAYSGDISIQAGDVILKDGALITANTYGKSNAGNISINASRSMQLSGVQAIKDYLPAGNSSNDFSGTEVSGVFSNAQPGSTGNAGNISVTTPALALRNGAQLSANTDGSGHAGKITVNSNDIQIDGSAITPGDNLQNASGIFAKTNGSASSQGGEINLNFRSLSLSNGATISSETLGAGNGGNIFFNCTSGNCMNDNAWLNATGVLSLNHIASILKGMSAYDTSSTLSITGTSAINTTTHGTGNAGHIVGEIGRVQLADSASFNVSSQSSAPGGNMLLKANQVELLRDASIGAENTGSGQAGSLGMLVADYLKLSGNSELSVATQQGTAGSIYLNVGNLVYLSDSSITTSAAAGNGFGGDIYIDPTLTVLNNSQIIANAFAGAAGNITIITDFFMPSTDSLVQASSQFGLQGTITINTQSSNIAKSIGTLSDNLLDSSNLLREQCGNNENASSFILTGRGGLPVSASNDFMLWQQ